jgi:hypothetical protein
MWFSAGLYLSFMKVTRYFLFMKQRPDRIIIKEDWILKAFKNPISESVHSDGRIKRWAQIDEADGKYLRIVLLEDRETVHNAFFDRSFKRGKT